MTNEDKASPCAWKEEEDGYWATTCGDAFDFPNGGTPEQNHFNHCPCCGKSIKSNRYIDKNHDCD